MKKIIPLLFAAICIAHYVHAQNTFPLTGAAGIGTTTPNASALLEISSTTQGFLPPCMTQTQRNAIASPAKGLVIFQIDGTKGLYYYSGTGWNRSFGANSTLSNLASPTAVNQALLPKFTDSLNLGSSALNWRNIHSSGSFYNGTNRIISFSGIGNSFLGYNTGTNNTGSFNSFIGNAAGAANTSAGGNSFFGFSAGYSNTTGGLNTAVGFRALASNQSSSYNAAFGDHALYSSGGNAGGNSAFGSACLLNNTTGTQNTSIGATSMYRTTTGYANSALGAFALVANETGSANTAIGDGADVALPDLSFCTALGAGALVNASYKVVVGGPSVTVIGGQVGWSTFSDGRFKKNIKENIPGLEFINRLKPVSYNVEIEKFERFVGRKDSVLGAMKKDIEVTQKKMHTGFIAQDIEKTAKEIGFDFDGVNTPQNEKDNYSLVYAAFVPSLVKAVQELSKINNQKDVKIDVLEKRIEKLEAAMNVQQLSVSPDGQTVKPNNVSLLEQNIPNPFNRLTTITYSLPQQYSKAKMIVSDKSGKTIKELNISGKGKGSVQIDAFSFSSGTYHYNLYVDGKMIGSQQMVIAR